MRFRRQGRALPRRAVLRAAALGAVAVPLAGGITACDSGFVDRPDPLLPLLARARADAAAAEALAASAPGQAELVEQVAAARSAHARALRAEIERLNRPAPEHPPQAPASTVADVEALGARLSEAREQAAGDVAGMPAYRAGLAGSIAAGCASLQRLAPALGESPSGELRPARTGKLTEEAVAALQGALATEHAAMWVYGLVSAFLGPDFAKGIDAGTDAHRDRRDVSERVLTAAGATPVTAEPAYPPPEPVTDAASAMRLVVTAESDAAAAWHGVLERTSDAPLRRMATQALVGAATRATGWRLEAGSTPAAPALPGRQQAQDATAPPG